MEYPTKYDPEQIEQLVEYTIAADIQLFEVPKEFLHLEKIDQLKKAKNIEELDETFSKFPITKAKTNSLITLSLEAERCLQNIYIKVKDVAS